MFVCWKETGLESSGIGLGLSPVPPPGGKESCARRLAASLSLRLFSFFRVCVCVCVCVCVGSPNYNGSRLKSELTILRMNQQQRERTWDLLKPQT